MPYPVLLHEPAQKKPAGANQSIQRRPKHDPEPDREEHKDTHRGVRHVMMLTAFFARVSPVSNRANPACMENTSIAASTVHT